MNLRNDSVIKLLMFTVTSLFALGNLQAQTKLMRSPAIGKDKIAFVYANDLWVADLNGQNPKRLTVGKGVESNPIFSPNGATIAFNAEYDGNWDVYTIPTKGGVPKRLTWHPYNEINNGFTPDGKSVVFASQRNSFTNRYFQLYTMPTSGGASTQLEIPNAFWASYSPNGSHIAYTPIFDAFNQWKHYRGGTASKIWIYNTKTHKIEEISKPAGGSNDSQPQWMGDYVYFKSDRDGEFNLYRYHVSSKEIEKLTNYTDFPVINISANNGKVIFEQKGELHIYDVASKTTKDLNITINTDLLELRPRYVNGQKYVRSGGISPSGARAVVDFRGDIVTVPAEKGDAKNLTNTPGVHEKHPRWSPDGKSIAYFSDASGEYALHIQDATTGSVKKVTLNGNGFYANINWAPDSKKLCFVDNGRVLYVYNNTTNNISKIDTDEMYIPGAFRELFGSWSHDSKWIAYTKIIETNFEKAFVYSLDTKKSYAVSDGLSNVREPTFDKSGKYLYMLASTDAGPLVNWFDQSNLDMRSTSNIYLVTLQKDVKSPLAKQSDEENAPEPKKEEKPVAKSKKGKKKKEMPKPSFKIDFDGFESRIISLPIPSGTYYALSSPAKGELYYIARNDGKSVLKKYVLKDQKEKELLPTNAYEISANGKKMMYSSNGAWSISNIGAKADKGPLNFNAVKVKINPKEEWKNIFNETWRVNRDYFYDPNMHGANWNAIKAKYEPFLAHLTSKDDVYRVGRWMCSELGVGHHRFGSEGDQMIEVENISGGLLGANYVVKNNRYQIAKIFGGLNWTPSLRSPLTEPGVDVNVGDYIIAVNGKNLTANDNIYSYFENTANKIVTLKVSKNADGSNARTVKVTPLATEWSIRNRDWVEGNMKKVHKATNGQVAYVYVPNTSVAGHEYFKRYFYPQAKKKAIIVDERFNGGGSLADYYIDILKRPEQSYWNFRYGKDLKAPSASIQGPKVMLIDETAGSGGDYLPWMFRKFKLGTLVGKRTWGGLVGILGYPEFIDGGSVTAPNVAFYDENGFGVENVGVAPDIEVDQLPEKVIKGEDPQLDKAIDIIMKQLKENPPKEMKTPKYPIRVKN